MTLKFFCNDGGVVPDYVMLFYMPWINYFHSNGPCVNYLISGSNPKPCGATAILMCISKVGGAYEFSACHSSYLCNILFWKTFNCHPDNCKYVLCTTLVPKMALDDI